MQSDMTSFCVTIIWETPMAIKVSDGANEIWLPLFKKNGEPLMHIRMIRGSDAEITLPVSLAKEKGII
jgi:hypothetical protein